MIGISLIILHLISVIYIFLKRKALLSKSCIEKLHCFTLNVSTGIMTNKLLYKAVTFIQNNNIIYTVMPKRTVLYRWILGNELPSTSNVIRSLRSYSAIP